MILFFLSKFYTQQFYRGLNSQPRDQESHTYGLSQQGTPVYEHFKSIELLQLSLCVHSPSCRHLDLLCRTE